MGRRPIPANLKKTRQYCVMVEDATADRIEAIIASGRYLAGADLLRDALMAHLDQLDAETDPTGPQS